MKEEKIKLDEFIWELWALTAADDLLDQSAAEKLGLNHTDTQSISLLINLGPMPAGELAEKIGVTNATMTTVIDRLESLRFARRISDPDDRRRVLIKATPEAKNRSREIFEGLRIQISALLADYDEEAQQQIVTFLRQMRQVFTRQARVVSSADSDSKQTS